MAVHITMAYSDNPRVQPLRDGTVKPEGIDLEMLTVPPSDLFYRNLAYDEFDASEMSISETLLALERSDGTKWDWSALPVFLSRGHVWPSLYVNSESGIESLADIKGKRVGIPDYDMTAGLWFRATLKDLYGIEACDNTWSNGRTKEHSHGGALGLDDAGPVGVTHHWLTVDQTLDAMLDRGEIDAFTAMRSDGPVTAGDPTVIDRILDLAGNSLRHGLPEEEREWSLDPRGKKPPGEYPVIRCLNCDCLSPAGSHQCNHCGEPFGELCDRCGAWRVWERWSRKAGCLEEHDPVCDLCHYDAHIQVHLPVTEELKELAMLVDEYELSPNRDPFLKNLLEEERRRVSGGAIEKQSELRDSIRKRESEIQDTSVLWQQFDQSLLSMPVEQRPDNEPEKAILFVQWIDDQKAELNRWRDELTALESRPLDKQLIYNNARDRLIRMFDAEAREAGLLSQKQSQGNPLEATVEQHSLKGVVDRKSHADMPNNTPSPKRRKRLASNTIAGGKYSELILESLIELGGSAQSSKVLERVEEKVRSNLTASDREPFPPQLSMESWEHDVQVCRYNLVHKRGFLRSDSPRGVWEITDSGRRYL